MLSQYGGNESTEESVCEWIDGLTRIINGPVWSTVWISFTRVLFLFKEFLINFHRCK